MLGNLSCFLFNFSMHMEHGGKISQFSMSWQNEVQNGKFDTNQLVILESQFIYIVVKVVFVRKCSQCDGRDAGAVFTSIWRKKLLKHTPQFPIALFTRWSEYFLVLAKLWNLNFRNKSFLYHFRSSFHKLRSFLFHLGIL